MISRALAVCALSLCCFSAAAGQTEHENAKKIALSIERATQDRAKCEAKPRTETVLCVIDASNREADRIANGIVSTTKTEGIALAGWKLTLVTPSDHVVTRRF